MSAATSAAIVRDFCAAWERLDIDELIGYFETDAVYHNMPIDPVTGADAIRATIQMFTTGVERIEFRVLNLASDGDTVLTERVDVFVLAHATVELPVMGTFEIRNGRIAAWRDYFDLQQYLSQAAPPT